MGAPATRDPKASRWGAHPLSEKQPTSVEVGPLRLFLARTGSEIRIARQQRAPVDRAALSEAALAPAYAEPEDQGGEELDWSRYAFRSLPAAIDVLPCFPDRSVILGVDQPLTLHPGSSVRIFVTTPVWVAVVIPGKEEGDDVTVLEVPSVTLSSTWFGDFLEGELCYWTPTRARRVHDPELVADHLVTCPIQISNQSEEPLPVDKLCLRVQHISIFEDQGHLWADETRIAYRGGGDFSRIRWTGKAPKEALGGRKLQAARVPSLTGLTAWTFAHLTRLPGWELR